MSALDTGGPAFPAICESVNGVPMAKGLTVRDYFAARVMGGMCSGGAAPQRDELEYLANRAYDAADAMLAARSGKGADDGPDATGALK